MLRDLMVDNQLGRHLVGTLAGQGEGVEILDEQGCNLAEHQVDLTEDTFPWQLPSTALAAGVASSFK